MAWGGECGDPLLALSDGVGRALLLGGLGLLISTGNGMSTGLAPSSNSLVGAMGMGELRRLIGDALVGAVTAAASGSYGMAEGLIAGAVGGATAAVGDKARGKKR